MFHHVISVKYTTPPTCVGGTSAQCQLQLVGGIGPNSGFLQVFVGEWRYMSLSSEVTPDGVNGLCQEMGFEGASNATMVPIDNVR